MGKKRIILDTNVIISGLGFKSYSRKVIEKTLKYYLWITSDAQIQELERVLNYPKFDFEEKLKEEILVFVKENTIVVSTKTNLNVIKDNKDNFLITLAVDGKAHIIVSGDKHLLDFEKYKATKIISPRKFIDSI